MQTVVAKSDTYVYPPRSKSALPRHETAMLADFGWIANYKFNDSHLLLKLLPNDVEFWGRKGERLAYRPDNRLVAELRAAQDILGLDRDQYHLLDGGLLDSRHPSIKDVVVIWDILVRDGEHLLGSTYKQRCSLLMGVMPHNDSWFYRHQDHDPIDFGVRLTDNVFMPRSYSSPDWTDMWHNVDVVNKPYTDSSGKVSPVLEGLMFKDINGKLEYGFRENNNTHFMVRSRVTTRRHHF